MLRYVGRRLVVALAATLVLAAASPASRGVATLALAVSPAAAATTVIGFDDQANGTVIGEQYAALGVHFGPSPFAGQSGTFTAAARAQARSAANLAAFAYDPVSDFSSSWIKFDKPQTKVSLYACRTGGPGDPPSPNFSVVAYDANGVLVDNQPGIGCTLNGPLVPVTIQKDGISYLSIYGNGGAAAPGVGWGLDDLTFDTAPPPPPPSPPPPPPPPTAQPADCPQRGSLFVGTNANDTINGTPLSDVILGVGGNDTLRGLAGRDCLYGLSGSDRISGDDGDDNLDGGSGSDRTTGGTGNDRISGDDGNDNLDGGSGSDRTTGGTGNDRISGDDGNDNLDGGSGSDRTTGGTGNDRISGGPGNDPITGGSGSDRTSGGPGSDRISGGSGRDRISGGSGNDRISARDRTRDTINCGIGRDRVSADHSDRVARDCEVVRRR